VPRPLQVLLALLPLLLTPVLFFALAEGYLDLGGGEKDLVMVLPWLLWSLLFAVTATVLIVRRRPVVRWITVSGVVATGLLFAIGLVAWAGSFLGIA
jgi:hypothetical protein